MLLKKCDKCGAVIKVLKDCKCEDCGINCCDEVMKEIDANSVDAAFEKHVPVYEISGDNMTVKVNHVMDDDHYIEWIAVVTENSENIVYFKPGDIPQIETSYVKGAKLYAYCNKHSLWESKVE